LDRFSIVTVRASLVWMLSGFVVGALMLVDREIPGNWRQWLQPTHGHMLFVGWFVQFVIGIAYWLLPRKRNPERPLGYREAPAFAGAIMLNAGMILRAIGEPMERIGNAGGLSIGILALSGVLQVGAIVIFISQIWPRIYGRNKMGAATAKS